MSYAVSATRTEQGIRERMQQNQHFSKLNEALREEREMRLQVSDELHKTQRDLAKANVDIQKLETRLSKYEASRITGTTVLTKVANQHGIPVAAILGNGRTASVVKARFEAYYAVVDQCPHLSISQVATLFQRDHTTLLSALEKRAAKAGIEVLPLERREA